MTTNCASNSKSTGIWNSSSNRLESVNLENIHANVYSSESQINHCFVHKIDILAIAVILSLISGNSECGGQLDLVLLLDSSGSVTQTHFEKTLSFVAYLVGLLGLQNDKTRVGLVTFSTKSRIIFHLDSYNNPYSLAKAIMATSYTPGKTNMADALNDMRTKMFQRERGDRPGVPNIGLLIADGYSSLYSPETVTEAQRARARGIQMYTIGIGVEDSDELKLIAQSKDRMFQTEDFDSLMNLASKMHQAICEGLY